MGLYRFKDDCTDDSTGILEVGPPIVHLTPDTNNAKWNAYLTWKAVPNTPDVCTITAIASVRKTAKAKIDLLCDVEFAKDIRVQGLGSGLSAATMLALVSEARTCIIQNACVTLAGAPAEADYPLLTQLKNSNIGSEGAAILDVAASIMTWWQTVGVRVGQTAAKRWVAHKAINAAANKAAVDAITFTPPAGGAGE